MNGKPSEAAILPILEEDRFWSAYALADLEPPNDEFSRWYIQDGSLMMTFHGFHPPTIFAAGDTSHLGELTRQLPAGRYQITLKQEHLAEMADRFTLRKMVGMLRMVHSHPPLDKASPNGVVRLGHEHLPAMEALFHSQPDRPDAFHPRQLAAPFYGIYSGATLIAAAGTHVYSNKHGIAAIGNVYTHRDHRNQGLAGQTVGAVLRALTREGVDTILLNVNMDNAPAIRCYTRLGFTPFCKYYEGWGLIRE